MRSLRNQDAAEYTFDKDVLATTLALFFRLEYPEKTQKEQYISDFMGTTAGE